MQIGKSISHAALECLHVRPSPLPHLSFSPCLQSLSSGSRQYDTTDMTGRKLVLE